MIPRLSEGARCVVGALFPVVLGLLLTVAASSTNAVTDDAAARTDRFTVTSKALAETREILVRRPPGFDPDQRYPVVYTTDGEWNFELVAAYLDYLADNSVYPPVIVSGVVNVNRNRDYVPRPDKYFEDTGRADAFLDFVERDWMPAIAGYYPVAEQSVLVGHSFGGVFVLHSLFSGRDLFDAYIALGSSAWIADRVLFDEAEAWFKDNPAADDFVYMAVGEGDGGPTVPSSKALADLFEEQAPASLEWAFDVTPRTDHFKNVMSGMHDGFMALFPAWGFPDELALAAEDGAAGVDRWFAATEKSLGWRFYPAWFDLGVLAQRLAREGNVDAARAITRHLREYHPADAFVAQFSAAVYASSEDWEAAASEYRRAIALAESQSLHPNSMHIAPLQRGLARAEARLKQTTSGG